MADCATCSRPLGERLRRCKRCGACEDCCQDSDEAFVPFSPAELGLDPEDYDLEVWENRPRNYQRKRDR